MLKIVRTALIVLFVLALLGAGALFYYNYTHEDTQPPVFAVDEELIEVSVKASRAELCSGLRAYDNMDGDITSKIIIQNISPLFNGTDVTVSYLVFDSASNYAVCQRTVRYTDYTPPHFHLDKPMIFNVGDTVTFLDRVSAYDVRDGNITGRITLTQSSVISSMPGNYQAVLAVTNRMGDTVSLPLTVSIVTRTASMPQIQLSDYLVYVKAGDSLDLRSMIRKIIDPMTKDEPLKSRVRIMDEQLDLNTPGTYEVHYFYTGASDEQASVILTVIVE